MKHLLSSIFVVVLCTYHNIHAAEEFKTTKGKVVITPINHATMVMEWDGKTIYVDPVGMADWYKAFPKPDVVLLTHVHGDHYKEAVLKAVVGSKTKIIAPPLWLEFWVMI